MAMPGRCSCCVGQTAHTQLHAPEGEAGVGEAIKKMRTALSSSLKALPSQATIFS